MKHADDEVSDDSSPERARGDHIAPRGLYERFKRTRFAGRVWCNVDRIVAGSWTDIVLTYEVGASGIADGSTFKATFKFYSDWALFQTADPTAANYISADYQAAVPVEGQSAATVQSLSVRFDQKGHERPFQKAIIVDVVDGYLNMGDRIILRLGDRRAGGPGTRVQTFIEDGFRFRCYVDPLGTSRFIAVPDDVSLAIVADVPAHVVINGPRFVRPGVAAPFRLSLQDRWGNIVSDAGGAVRLQGWLDGNPAYDRRIDMPATGWSSAEIADLPRSPGTLRLLAHRDDARDVTPGEAWMSIEADWPASRSFFGDLHVHAHDTVGTNSPDYNAAYARDVAGIDVFGYTANDFQITDANWEQGVGSVNAFNQPGRFVAFAVQEWCGSSTAGGDHQVIFLSDDAPDFPYAADGRHNRTLLWNEDMKGTSADLGRWPLEDLWSAYAHDPENHLIIPHVGGRRAISDWHHPELERLIEIASAWGHFPWLYQDVIARGYQLGVCASGDEHRGRPGGGSPGVQVFGVRGGLTGVLADALDRSSVGKALRARHTWATTGERNALLVRCGDNVQGDAFTHEGPAELRYTFLGQTGWDALAAFDHTGRIWHRNLHEELGYSDRRIRLRWGGARIKDRYRWAAWDGRIRVINGTIDRYSTNGFEHSEENAWRAGPTDIRFKSETYGDADSLELDIGGLADCRIEIEGTIGGFVKVGDPRTPTPFVHAPSFKWSGAASELLAKGRVHLDLGGTDLFIALDRLSDKALPTDVRGTISIDPRNGPFGFRPVYLFGQQRDGSKVWSSAQFIRFTETDKALDAT